MAVTVDVSRLWESVYGASFAAREEAPIAVDVADRAVRDLKALVGAFEADQTVTVGTYRRAPFKLVGTALGHGRVGMSVECFDMAAVNREIDTMKHYGVVRFVLFAWDAGDWHMVKEWHGDR